MRVKLLKISLIILVFLGLVILQAPFYQIGRQIFAEEIIGSSPEEPNQPTTEPSITEPTTGGGPGGAPVPSIDLSISRIRPVQVVWDSKIDNNDTIDLVAGKSTMIRIEVKIDRQQTETIITTDTVFEAGEYNFGNLTITNGARLILKSDPSSEREFTGVRINAENLIVDSDSAILADGAGYPGGQGSGAGKTYVWTSLEGNYYYGSGAGYGGKGGAGYGVEGGFSYGNLEQPTNLGSGGGNAGSAAGGAGGGAVIINITGTLTINGNISANGRDGGGSPFWGGGGSGGSVDITANILEGSGSILANGGSGYGDLGGGGGGGRITIYYNSKDGFRGFIQARGGNGFSDGESGTIFLKSSTEETSIEETSTSEEPTEFQPTLESSPENEPQPQYTESPQEEPSEPPAESEPTTVEVEVTSYSTPEVE